MKTRAAQNLIKEYRDYARKQGFRLNPDKKILANVIQGLLQNEEKYGKRYCPCRRVTGDIAEDQKKVCPCAFHRKELDKLGQCLCGLFVR